MKKLLIVAASCFLLLSCGDKKISASDVPQPVMTAFQAKYPNATDVKWEKEKEDGKDVYSAECKFNGKDIEAEFEPDGKFMKEE